MYKINKVITVPMIGGIIGIFYGTKTTLNNAVQNANSEGWNVVNIIDQKNGGFFRYIWRLILLCITLFFYTTDDGYYVILEKPR